MWWREATRAGAEAGTDVRGMFGGRKRKEGAGTEQVGCLEAKAGRRMAVTKQDGG